MKARAAASVLLVSSAAVLSAAASPFQPISSQTEEVAASDDLDRELARLGSNAERRWLGWSVPLVPGTGVICCGDGSSIRRSDGRLACRLGQSRSWCHGECGQFSGSVDDEQLFVFAGVANGRVVALRSASESCRVEGGGETLTWLEGVSTEGSIGLLEGLLDEGRSSELRHRALAILAHHAGSAADRALVELASRRGSAALRREAAFWLGEARGELGLETLERLLRSGDDQDRAGLVFAVSQSRVATAKELLSTLARADEDPEIRREALFWLAQEGGPEAEEAVRRAVWDQADRDLSRHAIFVAAQLPGESGVELLVEVAVSELPSDLRQQAFFWLAQSDHPAAWEFFQETLSD